MPNYRPPPDDGARSTCLYTLKPAKRISRGPLVCRPSPDSGRQADRDPFRRSSRNGVHDSIRLGPGSDGCDRDRHARRLRRSRSLDPTVAAIGLQSVKQHLRDGTYASTNDSDYGQPDHPLPGSAHDHEHASPGEAGRGPADRRDRAPNTGTRADPPDCNSTAANPGAQDPRANVPSRPAANHPQTHHDDAVHAPAEWWRRRGR